MLFGFDVKYLVLTIVLTMYHKDEYEKWLYGKIMD